MILRGSNKIDELSHLSLIRGFVEQFYQVDIVWLALEMRLEEVIDRGLEHEGVVDGYQTDVRIAEPTGLGATSDRAIHNVVRDEEISL